MRFTIMALFGRYLPHRAWMALPESWRGWWADEWIRQLNIVIEDRDR